MNRWIFLTALFSLVLEGFCVEGFAVSISNGQGYLQYYGRTEGELWRHTIVNDEVTEHKKLFDGPGTRPCISPDGKNIAFIKEDKVAIISMEGGEVTELASCYKNSWLDFPDNEWIYYIQEGSFHEPNSNTLKRVSINSKDVETVIQFKNGSDGDGARVSQIQISNDLKRAVIRPGDNSESDPLGTILKYDLEANEGRFGSVLSGAWSCAAGISSDGQYALDGWGDHTGFDILNWDDGSNVTTFNNTDAYQWAPNSGASLPTHHAIFHSGGATNDPHWICVVVGSTPGHDQRNDIHGHQILINWQDQKCINVTKGMDNANFFDHGDFWVGETESPAIRMGAVNGWDGKYSFFVNGSDIFSFMNNGEIRRVEIVNLTGRFIRSVPVSAASIIWDGRDFRGRAAANGVYFIRAAVGGEVFSERFLLAE
jgi:hypothetical protein